MPSCTILVYHKESVKLKENGENIHFVLTKILGYFQNIVLNKYFFFENCIRCKTRSSTMLISCANSVKLIENVENCNFSFF